MRTKKPTKRVHSGERKIHFSDAVWTYRIYGGSVKIRDPNGFTSMMNYDQNCTIRPSDIKEYIEKNLTVRTK